MVRLEDSHKREYLCNKDMSLIKARLLQTALTKTFLMIDIHLKMSIKCLNVWRKTKTPSYIQKVDKGNTVMILDKCSYKSATEKTLNQKS